MGNEAVRVGRLTEARIVTCDDAAVGNRVMMAALGAGLKRACEPSGAYRARRRRARSAGWLRSVMAEMASTEGACACECCPYGCALTIMAGEGAPIGCGAYEGKTAPPLVTAGEAPECVVDGAVEAFDALRPAAACTDWTSESRRPLVTLDPAEGSDGTGLPLVDTWSGTADALGRRYVSPRRSSWARRRSRVGVMGERCSGAGKCAAS